MGSTIRSFDSLTFTSDFVFCHILKENKDLCKNLAELLTGREISKIVELDDQVSIQETVDGKGVRFDVEFKDELGTIYDIEMQRGESEDLPKRTRYYSSLADLDTLKAGESYHSIGNVYILFICTFDPFGKGLHRYTVRNSVIEDKNVPFEDGVTKIFYSATYRDDNVPKNVKQFLDYVRIGMISDSLTQEIDDKVKKMLNSKERRVEYMTLAEQYRWYQQEGFKSGHAEGKAEGKAEERTAIIKSLLDKGKSVEEIVSFLGFSETEVQSVVSASQTQSSQ